MKLTYICNAGILLSQGSWMAAVDAFAFDPDGLYKDTPPVWKEALLRAAADGNLRLLVITHEHADHYCRADVLQAMTGAFTRGYSLFLLTTQAVAQDLRDACPERMRCWLDRQMAVLQPWMEALELSLALPLQAPAEGDRFTCLNIRAVNTVHDGRQYAHVSNMMLMMELQSDTNSRKLVIPSDACPNAALFSKIAAWSKTVDWLIAPFPYVGRTTIRRMIASMLAIHHIAAYHFPVPERDAQGWYANTEAACRANAGAVLPAPLFLSVQGTEAIL